MTEDSATVLAMIPILFGAAYLGNILMDAEDGRERARVAMVGGAAILGLAGLLHYSCGADRRGACRIAGAFLG